MTSATHTLQSSFTLYRHLPKLSINEAIDQITAALKREGFGILTEIDVKATLKTKLDVNPT